MENEIDKSSPIMEEEPENKNVRSSISSISISRWALIIFIGLSIYLFISSIILIFLTKPKKEIVVPNVVGKQFVVVYNSLIRKKLRPDINFFDVYDIDDGIILNQHPRRGSIVPEDSKIKLTVSRSSQYISVPNLVGSKLPFALNKLKNLHVDNRTLTLRVGVISYLPSIKFADNTVIDHSPGEGEEITPDTKINFLVSAGKLSNDMKMPKVTGQSIDLCFDLLISKGLTVHEEIVQTDKKWRSGIVFSQEPRSGEIIKKGALVKLKIYYYPMKEHPFTSYERVTYKIPAFRKNGIYEVLIEDSKTKRMRFYRRMKPEWTIDFIFKRRGDAKISILYKKRVIEKIGIDVDDFR